MDNKRVEQIINGIDKSIDNVEILVDTLREDAVIFEEDEHKKETNTKIIQEAYDELADLKGALDALASHLAFEKRYTLKKVEIGEF